MSRENIQRFKEHLNNLPECNIGKGTKGNLKPRTRKYGDYLYAQDREMFMVSMEEWLKEQKG